MCVVEYYDLRYCLVSGMWCIFLSRWSKLNVYNVCVWYIVYICYSLCYITELSVTDDSLNDWHTSLRIVWEKVEIPRKFWANSRAFLKFQNAQTSARVHWNQQKWSTSDLFKWWHTSTFIWALLMKLEDTPVSTSCRPATSLYSVCDTDLRKKPV